MNIHLATTILAQSAGEQGAELFWNTTAGKVIGALLGAVGVIVVLVTAVKGFSAVAQGRPGQAFKGIAVAVVLSVFLFRPQTMNDLISFVADLIQSVISDTSELQDTVESGGEIIESINP